MGSEEPSALFFVADGAAKERVQCRDSRRKKKQRLKVHTKCSETWKNVTKSCCKNKFPYKKCRKKPPKRVYCNSYITIEQHLRRVYSARQGAF